MLCKKVYICMYTRFSSRCYNLLIPLRLVKRSGEKDYVHIQTTDSGCFVWTIGNTGGKQVLNDGASCSWGNMVHEFMHKLGITLTNFTVIQRLSKYAKITKLLF